MFGLKLRITEFLFLDILDNIQQLQKEMKNVRKTLNTLGLSEEKTKDEGQCEEFNSEHYMLLYHLTNAVIFEKKTLFRRQCNTFN